MSRMKLVTALAAASVLVVFVSGCVHRRLTIRSDPPGALARLEDREVGRTPVTVSFNFYGVRTISLEKDGYVRLVRNTKIKAPWYQVFPLDFFAEVLYPGHIFDDHTVEFKLERRRPYSRADTAKLLERGRQMRRRMIREVNADPLSVMVDEDPYWLDPKVPLREIR